MFIDGDTEMRFVVVTRDDGVLTMLFSWDIHYWLTPSPHNQSHIYTWPGEWEATSPTPAEGLA